MALKPSERVRLIQRIADLLAAEEWSIIDLTLRQFGLSTLDNWSGTREEYIYHLAADATDHILIDLAEHCSDAADRPRAGSTAAVTVSDNRAAPALTAPVRPSIDDRAAPAPAANNRAVVDAKFWKPGTFKLFVSHLAAERAYAGALQQALALRDVSCFVAHNDIEPALDWQNQIEAALATCDALAALLHPGFHDSKWCDQEIGYAMGRGVPVFAVRLGTDPYGFIGRFQGLNGQKAPVAAVARQLFELLCRYPQTQRVMAPILVEQFATSTSFADARAGMDRLEALEYWEPTFSTRILEAQQANNQVSNSHSVPDRIDALVGKWAAAAA